MGAGFGRGLRRVWAICAAMRMADLRLLGSALFLPVMSKAVPWSGEVRTIGKPRVRLWSRGSRGV